MAGPTLRERLKGAMGNDQHYDAIGQLPFMHDGASLQVEAAVISSVSVKGSLSSLFESDTIYCKRKL